MILPWNMKMTGLYYLSGPMSGYEEYNFPEFKRVTNSLRYEGLNIVSPHEQLPAIGVRDADQAYTENLRFSLVKMLDRCDGIIMLPGWPSSNGASLELGVALNLGFPVYYFDGHKVIDMNDARKVTPAQEKNYDTLSSIDPC